MEQKRKERKKGKGGVKTDAEKELLLFKLKLVSVSRLAGLAMTWMTNWNKEASRNF